MTSRLDGLTSISVICLALICRLTVSPTAFGQTDPSVVGQWSPLMVWPQKAVHAALLPNGKVLFWPSFELGDNPNLYDPAAGNVTAITVAGYNIFCAGHSFLANGQLFVTGGHVSTDFGLPNASTYDFVTDTWTMYPDMNAARWYPSNTTLANGDILVVSGDINPTVGSNALPQVFQASTGTWRDLASAQLIMPTYPKMFLLPNGTIFNASPSQQTRFLNTTGTGAWALGPKSNYGFRDYGPGVMYEPGKILLVGGGAPTATAEIIDLTVPNPLFQYTSSMSFPRRQANATLLADGKVLVTGGSCGSGFDNAACPVYPAEMWDPATGNWTIMASFNVYRGYHSIALLLPDGSVLSGGGSAASAEIFSPPYLFAGARPTLTSPPPL